MLNHAFHWSKHATKILLHSIDEFMVYILSSEIVFPFVPTLLIKSLEGEISH